MQHPLFIEKEKIRTLGFYQPFGSLMLHGKIETRWVRKGKKPPFPLGKYVFYTTQKQCAQHTLFDWCGPEIMHNISQTLQNDNTANLTEHAIGVGELVELRPMTKEDEPLAFVKFIGEKTEIIEGITIEKVQWALVFTHVERVEPFKGIKGKQGIGFLEEHHYAYLTAQSKSHE